MVYIVIALSWYKHALLQFREGKHTRENFQKQILNIPQRTAEEGGRIRRRRKNKEEEEDGVPASKGIPIT